MDLLPCLSLCFGKCRCCSADSASRDKSHRCTRRRLLHGGLKIDFAKEGRSRSMVLHFNTVMQALYSAAIRDLLDGIDESHSPQSLLDAKSRLMLQHWPLKFQNYAVIYMPRGSSLLAAAHWDTLRGAFGREIGPSAALLLSDRHLVLIAEENHFADSDSDATPSMAGLSHIFRGGGWRVTKQRSNAVRVGSFLSCVWQTQRRDSNSYFRLKNATKCLGWLSRRK